MSAPESLLVRACKRLAVERTPVWFMRQAGRYMPEYRAVRSQHSLIEICKNPELAAEVTITAAESLNVDAAIIFADLLLPLEVMGLPFRFLTGGPVIERPVRTAQDVARLGSDSASDLGYVSEAIRLVARHFHPRLPVIGFCGAPFTLASYMIEGGGSRHYVQTKKLMYSDPETFDRLLQKLVSVTSAFARDQIQAGADVIQIFDSWVGCLAPGDYTRYVLPRTRELVMQVKQSGAPVIYFGTDTTTLLSEIKKTRADVVGLDWRVPLDVGWSKLGGKVAVQGNLDPVALFASRKELEMRACEILDRVGARPGHIFNLGHGILPETPVENVKALASFVQEHSTRVARGQS